MSMRLLLLLLRIYHMHRVQAVITATTLPAQLTRLASCTAQAPMVNKGAAASFMGKSVSMPVKIESRTADGFNARTTVCAGSAIACKTITGLRFCSHGATLAICSQDNQTIQVQLSSPEVLVPSWYVVVAQFCSARGGRQAFATRPLLYIACLPQRLCNGDWQRAS